MSVNKDTERVLTLWKALTNITPGKWEIVLITLLETVGEKQTIDFSIDVCIFNNAKLNHFMVDLAFVNIHLHTVWHSELYICRLVCSVTPTHMISFSSIVQRTLQQKNVLPPTYTITCISFEFRMANIIIHICSVPTYTRTAQPSIHLSHNSSHALPPSVPSHLPGLQQGHTPQLPCARTHTHTKSKRGSAIWKQDKKGGGVSRFHATLSTG